MTDLCSEIDRCILDRRLLLPGQSLVVGVSGGVDSMVLLHLLHGLSTKHDWRLAVAHFNHLLRGRESEADERLVRKTARRLHLPIRVGREDVRAFAKAKKLSIEMAARKLRHSFLASIAREVGASKIVFAHHAEDQLELFFLRLLRGSGGDGLSGMKWANASPEDPSVQLVRPLLGHPKATLRQFAIEEKIPFREDSTNACLDFQRNRIRHELLPLLRKSYQPALEAVVSRTIDITSAEASFAAEAATQYLYSLRARKDGLGTIKLGEEKPLPDPLSSQVPSASWFQASLPPFDLLPVAVQRRCVQTQLLDLCVHPDYELIEHLRLTPGTPVCVSVQDSQGSAKALFTSIALQRLPSGLLHIVESPASFSLQAPLELLLDQRSGVVLFDSVRIQWKVVTAKSHWVPKQKPGQEIFDADLLGSRILLRHWRPGDRFQPIGMPVSVKLQNFLTNRKIPQSHRHRLTLGVDGRGEVFWVEGQRVSERFKLTENTIRRLHWAWQRL